MTFFSYDALRTRGQQWPGLHEVESWRVRPRTVREAEEQGQLSSPDTGWASTSLPPHPVSQVELTPGTWLMVTVRLSGRRTSGVVTAMPPRSACRRSSWISCGRAQGQQRPWTPDAQKHKCLQAYTEKYRWDTRGQRHHITESPRSSQSL